LIRSNQPQQTAVVIQQEVQRQIRISAANQQYRSVHDSAFSNSTDSTAIQQFHITNFSRNQQQQTAVGIQQEVAAIQFIISNSAKVFSNVGSSNRMSEQQEAAAAIQSARVVISSTNSATISAVFPAINSDFSSKSVSREESEEEEDNHHRLRTLVLNRTVAGDARRASVPLLEL
jgi:hypothetical protein